MATSPSTDRKITFGHIEIGDRARQLVNDALDRNWVSAGPHVAQFENLFKDTFGVREAVAVSSGTDACIVALAALHEFGATWGDEVVVPSLCFVASANAILAAGFRPLFVDVDRNTLNIDPEKIEAAITSRTRAIMVVHTMGRSCDMDAIREIAKTHKLRIIEDCCEAHGATYRGELVGTMGMASAFSFYAAHLICSGEGGMVGTMDSEVAPLLRSIRSHGRPDGSLYFDFQRYGFNSKMNDLEAAIGIEGIERYEAIFQQRRELLLAMRERLAPHREHFSLYDDEPDGIIAPHACPLLLREDSPYEMKLLYQWLEDRGIQCKTLFGSLPTQHPTFQFLGYSEGQFPEAEYIGQRGLHFGCHQYMNLDDVEYIAESIESFLREKRP